MLETSTTQSDLSRLSGVRQPSISAFLSGRLDLATTRSTGASRACRTATTSRSGVRRSSATWSWLSGQVTGEPHERNLQRWRDLVDRGDLPALHRVLTGLDRDSVKMREVSLNRPGESMRVTS